MMDRVLHLVIRLRARITLVFSFVILLTLASCSLVQRPIQTTANSEILLTGTNAVGQTFVSNFDGLEGIRFHLKPRHAGSGDIILHLRSSREKANDIAAARLPLSAIAAPGYYTFSFPQQLDSERKSYYVYLDLTGNAEVAVASAAAETYLEGAAYLNGSPTDAQLAFTLVHNPGGMVLGLSFLMLEWLRILLVAAFLFLPPGWAMLAWLYPKWDDLTWIVRACLALGASLAVYPLLILLTGIIGLKLGALYAWAPPVIGLVLIALKWWQRNRGNHQAEGSVNKPFSVAGVLPEIAFLLAVLALIFTRLWPVHSIEAPLFGDSYQHTLIAQLLVDHGGLFNSWEPYAPLSSFTYHFGFHTAVAAYHWITGEEIYRETLWVGQVLNILSILCLVPLAMRISKSRWTASITVLVAGLLAPMPMYYLNWGRYTQLAGQVVLPVFAFLVWSLLADREARRSTAVLIGILAAGLALNHYLVLIFAVIFTVLALPFALRKDWAREPLVRLVLAGVCGGLLFLPRFIQVFGGSILSIYGARYAPASGSTVMTEAAPIAWATYLPAVLWILLIASFLWSLAVRRWLGVLVGLWWSLILLIANPARLGLSFPGAVSSFAVLIAFYIPAGVLVGAAAGWVIEQSPRLFSKAKLPANAAAWAGITLIILSAFVGGKSRLSDALPGRFALLTRPDVEAMTWIRANTPQDSVFLVESLLAYSGSISAGSDGGWWLPYLTGRQSTQPPLNYGQEQSSLPDYRDRVRELTFSILYHRLDNPDTQKLLHDWGVTHIYIGQQQGSVNASPSIDVDDLLKQPWVKPVYHQDRVWIFELER